MTIPKAFETDHEQYRDRLLKIVAAIAPACLECWDGPHDKDAMAKETVDLAEALLKETLKRTSP